MAWRGYFIDKELPRSHKYQAFQICMWELASDGQTVIITTDEYTPKELVHHSEFHHRVTSKRYRYIDEKYYPYFVRGNNVPKLVKNKQRVPTKYRNNYYYRNS